MTGAESDAGAWGQRAEQIVAALPLADRIRLVSGRDVWTTEPVDGLVEAMWLADGPHGLRKQATPSDRLGLGESIPATCFPVAAVLASTWDPALLEEVGAALGREARAQDVGVLLGPGLNLKRHPRGGRNFEYLSEDPFLSGTLAAALVRGIQSQGVAACPKHYAANNQETGRMVLDAVIDERTLRELYLSGFEIVIGTAEPATVMTAYNQVNGQFASDHGHLVGEVLRGEWGFTGLVVSDWGGTNDRVAGLRAGMDLEMPNSGGAFDAEVTAAIADGRLAEAHLNRSAARVVERALRWTHERTHRQAPRIDPDAHHALARRAAAAGTVLLTNDGLLPLPAEGTLAVIGAFAVHPRYQGAGSSKVNPTRLDGLLDALTSAAGRTVEVRYAAGYDPVTGRSTPVLMARAAVLARTTDRVVLVVGLPDASETEGMDRAEWGLPADMDALVEVVLDANPRTAVVVVNGGAVGLPWADRPAAVLEAYLGGQAGGSALADVLLGTVEPGGRLAECIPFDVADLPADRWFPGHPRQVHYREGLSVGYRFHDTHGVPARFAFGHGLGYTTFDVGEVRLTGQGTDLAVAVEVTNTGQRPGSHVVQVYVHAVAPTVPRPAKELAGFARVSLDPGATGWVEVRLDRRSFAVWDAGAHDWRVGAGDYEVLVGASSTDLRGRASVHLDTGEVLTPVPRTTGPAATDAEFATLLGRHLPDPAPVRPFTRLSTAADLRTSVVGRPLVAVLRRALANRLGADGTDAADLVEAVLAGLPLRVIVALTPGMTFAGLDRMIALLNGDVRGIVRPRR